MRFKPMHISQTLTSTNINAGLFQFLKYYNCELFIRDRYAVGKEKTNERKSRFKAHTQSLYLLAWKCEFNGIRRHNHHTPYRTDVTSKVWR